MRTACKWNNHDPRRTHAPRAFASAANKNPGTLRRSFFRSNADRLCGDILRLPPPAEQAQSDEASGEERKRSGEWNGRDGPNNLNREALIRTGAPRPLIGAGCQAKTGEGRAGKRVGTGA